MSLVARDLRFGYGETPVLRSVSLELRPGETVALVGPNGAGKSTVLRLLSRVLRPQGGELELDGASLAKLPRRALARRLAVVPQGGALPEGFRAHEIALMGRTPHLGLVRTERPGDHAAVEAAMRRTDTWRLRGRRVEELSGGERQRLLLARALAQEPAYLLLDEPTSHLDLRYQVEAVRFVRAEVARGLGALVVLHDLNLAARAADRLLVLARGRIVAAGTPTEVLTEGLLREVYSADAAVSGGPDGEPVVLPRL